MRTIKIITALFIAVLIGLNIFIIFFVDVAAASPSPFGVTRCVNTIRVEYGVKRVRPTRLLVKAGRAKLIDMRRWDYWAHRNPVTGSWVWDSLEEGEYGEVLAKGFNISTGVCEGWRNSPTHLKVITDPQYSTVGIAIRRGVVVGVFGE